MTDDAQSGQNALQRLIADAKARAGKMSYQRMAERAGTRPDGTPWIIGTQIQKYATAPLRRPPQAAAIVGLARALGLTESIVRAAVGEAQGYRDPLPGEARGYTVAYALAERIDAVDDPVARDRLLWAVERLVSSVEGEFVPVPEPAQPADDLGELAESLFDSLPKLDDDQRRLLIAKLTEELGKDVENGRSNGSGAG